MPVDGVFLNYLCNELNKNLVGSIVQKIYQPSSRMIIIVLRKDKKNLKLLVSAAQNSPRLHLTYKDFENPKAPPAFCMFLRKKLISAKIKEIKQHELERVVFVNFEGKDELGDNTQISLVCEIMGKYSNIILLSNNIVLDSIVRVNSGMSSKRIVMPGQKYSFPPSQGKIPLKKDEIKNIVDKVFEQDGEEKIENAFFNLCQGVSLATSKRLIDFIGFKDKKVKDLTFHCKSVLFDGIKDFVEDVYNCCGEPVDILDEINKTKDISFKKFSEKNFSIRGDFSSLLDDFYYLRDKSDIIKCKVSSLSVTLRNKIACCKKKIDRQRKEIESCKDKDKYKIYGDLILSNLHVIKKGSESVKLKDFYSDGREISIKLDPCLDAAGNAKMYYKKYSKCKSAVLALSKQVDLALQELKYLENALEYLFMCESDDDIEEIKKELKINGYLKSGAKIEKKFKSEPFCFNTPSGLNVFVGKNSIQNEKLTFSIAKKGDIWFHVKDFPGSHTILLLNGNEPDYDSILFAAKVCCIHSKAKDSSNVAVDYTNVSNVKKIPGGRTGMVRYKNYKTIYVTPDDIIDKNL